MDITHKQSDSSSKAISKKLEDILDYHDVVEVLKSSNRKTVSRENVLKELGL